MPLRDQSAEVLLQRISARTGQLHDVADSNSSVFASEFNDAHRQLGQGSKNDLLPFDFPGQTPHLLLQCTEEEQDPGMPVRGICPDRHLGLAKGEIIALFALFNHAFERAVRNPGIACAEQKESRKDAAQPAISVLERMDLEKNHREDRGH